MKTDILIIGAGLTGLTTAYTLASNGKNVHVLERMERPGGQIHTYSEDGFVFEYGIMVRFAEKLSEVSTVESEPTLEGRNMTMMLAPKKEI